MRHACNQCVLHLTKNKRTVSSISAADEVKRGCIKHGAFILKIKQIILLLNFCSSMEAIYFMSA